jgi:hypothetical protein
VLASVDAPLSGDSVAGLVSIQGIAGGDAFESYSVEYLLDGIWQPIVTLVPVSTAGELASWDTTLLPNTVTVVRLTVFGVGGERAEVSVTVQVLN